MALKRIEENHLPVRQAGGDNTVERDSMGRPYILSHCHNEACVDGRVPSEKKPPPATIQCPKCKGSTQIRKAYTRTTTFIDVIEDKSNLMAWHGRMVLVGVDIEPDLLNRVGEHWDVLQNSEDPDEKKAAKDWLTRRSETAKDKAGANEAADKGTYKHGLSELVDQGIELPDEVSFEDTIDMHDYAEKTKFLDIVHMEQLMCLDEFQVAGTPDRISTVREGYTLVAPDGHVFGPGERIITDLKTGTVEYGALKMAMQLSIYAHSKLYKDGIRTEVENLNKDWGIIMNLPADSGECALYWADLRMGWRAVRIAREIRQLRTEGRRALTSFVSPAYGDGV